MWSLWGAVTAATSAAVCLSVCVSMFAAKAAASLYLSMLVCLFVFCVRVPSQAWSQLKQQRVFFVRVCLWSSNSILVAGKAGNFNIYKVFCSCIATHKVVCLIKSRSYCDVWHTLTDACNLVSVRVHFAAKAAAIVEVCALVAAKSAACVFCLCVVCVVLPQLHQQRVVCLSVRLCSQLKQQRLWMYVCWFVWYVSVCVQVVFFRC